jgi:hypothetical protein
LNKSLAADAHRAIASVIGGFAPVNLSVREPNLFTMNQDQIEQKLEDHIKAFFRGHKRDFLTWEFGPVKDELPKFRVMRIKPGRKTELWTYCSVGAWEVIHQPPSMLEFLVLSPSESVNHVELLAMVAHYHLKHRLGIGHTVPIGRPWLPNSSCDHLLISSPYPFGPDLEICNLDDDHIHLLWLLPITKAECDFKVEKGVEALEELFEQKQIHYWDPKRKSVV